MLKLYYACDFDEHPAQFWFHRVETHLNTVSNNVPVISSSTLALICNWYNTVTSARIMHGASHSYWSQKDVSQQNIQAEYFSTKY